MRKKFFIFLLVLGIFSARSQQEYATSNIEPELLENANAVLRQLHQKIVIEDLDRVVTYTTRVVTVLNEDGETYVDAYEYYSPELHKLIPKFAFSKKRRDMNKLA